MFKKIFYQSAAASLLTAIAAIIYNRIYHFATETDYSRIINYGSILAMSVLVCFVIGIIYYGMHLWLKQKADIAYNLVLSIGSFCAVIYPISVSLPLEVKFPELFPGLAVPMVFFPAMAWYTLNPIFRPKEIIHLNKNGQ